MDKVISYQMNESYIIVLKYLKEKLYCKLKEKSSKTNPISNYIDLTFVFSKYFLNKLYYFNNLYIGSFRLINYILPFSTLLSYILPCSTLLSY